MLKPGHDDAHDDAIHDREIDINPSSECIEYVEIEVTYHVSRCERISGIVGISQKEPG